MMTTLLTTTNGKDEFFPTPKNLALKMLSDINWDQIKTILEPSAGKGNLVEFALRESHKHYKWRGKELDIDCIKLSSRLTECSLITHGAKILLKYLMRFTLYQTSKRSLTILTAD